MKTLDELILEHPTLFHLKGGYSYSCGNGWVPLVEAACHILKKYDGAKFLQVKEKFGGLRMYTDIESDLIHSLEDDSFSICETCGEKGVLRSDRPWIKTLCEKHK